MTDYIEGLTSSDSDDYSDREDTPSQSAMIEHDSIVDAGRLLPDHQWVLIPSECILMQVP